MSKKRARAKTVARRRGSNGIWLDHAEIGDDDLDLRSHTLFLFPLMAEIPMDHPVVSEQQWIEASQALLRKEKEFTRARDALSAERRKLPWLKVTKNYVFTTPEGPKTLGDLFGKNSQLIVYHFMFAPGWKEGCPGCSFISDHVDGALPHLTHHDVSFVAVSCAELEEFLPDKKRMGCASPGCRRPAVTSIATIKSRSPKPTSPAVRPCTTSKRTCARAGRIARHQHLLQGRTGGRLPHLSSYARGGDMLLGAYNWLDLTPKGRNEGDRPMSWMRRHDQYE